MTYRMSSSVRPDRNQRLLRHPELQDWFRALDLQGKTPTTIENYAYTVIRFVERYDKSLLEATDTEIDAFLSSLPPASRKTRLAHLSSFFRWAKKKRRIAENPIDFVEDIKPPARKNIKVFEPWQQAKLIQADPGRMAIQFYGGLRISEAMNLRGRDVDLQNMRLIVERGKGGKGRIVEIGEVAAAHIADMMLVEGIGPDDYIWFCRPGGHEIRRNVPVGEFSFREWWKECIRVAGVEYRKPHTTRHTFATMMLRAGVRLERLQELMGHESISTTKDLYGHLNSQDIRADVALFDNLLRETVEKPRETVA